MPKSSIAKAILDGVQEGIESFIEPLRALIGLIAVCLEKVLIWAAR